VKDAQVALVPPFGHQGGRAISEGETRQPAISHARQELVGGNGQSMLHDRLAKQGMDEVGCPRAPAVPPEQLAVGQTKHLPPLSWRQVFAVLQPGMTPCARGTDAPTAQSQCRDGPSGMTRPATNLVL